LGYHRDEVESYSYDRSSEVYSEEDTYRGLMRSAEEFGEQLNERAAEHPGKPVDLVGHSQGGVVIRLFLHFYWQGHKSEYPPIGNVVFFASPQNGTPAARIAKNLSKTPVGPALEVADALGAPGPDLTSPAIADLSDDSEVSKFLASTPVPKDLHVLSIGATFDPLVPPQSAIAKGSDAHYIGNAGDFSPFDDHEAILHDPEALAAYRAFVERRKLPCMGLSDALLGATGELILGEGERAAADLIGRFAVTR
jgi:pimeloyl-ACP methyl ester carboxylesterase